MRGESINRNMRENVFIQRVWGIWNRLPQEVVEVGAIAAFKRLDKYVDRKPREIQAKRD